MAGGFLSLTAFQAEGDSGGFAAVFYNAAFGGPPPPLRGPPPPDERWEASLKGVVSFPPTKWDRGFKAAFLSSFTQQGV